MKPVKLHLFAFLLLTQLCSLYGQSKRKYVNEFMYVGVGARQLAMGKAGVASTNDVYANYWNPAALSDIKDNLQVGFMHNFYFQSLANYDYLCISGKPKNNNSFGFSILRFGVDKILNTLDLVRNGQVDYQRVSEFSAVDYAFMPSFSHNTIQARNKYINVGWGVTGKIIHRKVGPFANSWGFGADAALRINDYNQKYGFSLIARDITSTFNNWTFNFTDNQKDIYAQTGETLPLTSLEIATPRFIAGGFYTYDRDKFVITPEANFEFTTDGKRNTLVSSNFLSIDPRIGLETGIVDNVKNFQALLRLGVYNFQKQINSNNKKSLSVNPSMGIGLKIDNLKIDYALTALGEGGAGLYSNVISISLGINKDKK